MTETYEIQELKKLIKNKGKCDQHCDVCPLQKSAFKSYRYECGYVDMSLDAFLRGEPANKIPEYIVEEAINVLTKMGAYEDIVDILL